MEHHAPRDHATSNVLAWTAAHSANVEPSVEEDAGTDADEPPDRLGPISPISNHFHRTPIRRGSEQHESLLTKALQSQSDEDTNDSESRRRPRRRRSIISNASLASTADFTCGTGITTPARTSSPSPRLPNVGFVPPAVANKDPAVGALEKKRCISFACAAKPKPDEKAPMPLPPKQKQDGGGAGAPPKKTSIKFACPSQPSRIADVQQLEARPRTPVSRGTPSTPKGVANLDTPRSSSTVRAFRSPTSRKTPGSPQAVRNKRWLTAGSGDLASECARFHEFASDELQEDDWILRDHASLKPKLTIDDTLEKENAIRKLGKEAEEEAELEEEELDEEEDDEEVDEADLIDEDDDGDPDDDDESRDTEESEESEDEVGNDEDEDGTNDDADTEHAWASEQSEGYKTDNEVGFAESDDEDDDLVLWTTRIGRFHSLSGAVSMMARRRSQDDNSDSSASSKKRSSHSRKKKRSGTRPVPFRSDTPELPDSTDFVCGTLDEDKPLEEAYITCVEARRRDRHQLIPQDIDPSFPTSEPEDEAEELYRKGYGDSEEHVWLHGEFEDLHHDRDRRGRKKKGTVPSPKRCRSPPPKRRLSPAPMARGGRSPRKLYEQRSPRLRSPAPLRIAPQFPIISPIHGAENIAFKSLASGPGLTQTKSLPKAPGMFPHLKVRRSRAGTITEETHVRGAIDIVKGLEKKRQRRREKYYQKYCNRARKEKAQTKRPPPGQGAERMRELGLLMAGKAGHGNYVLSI
ncbi:hypothetical protein N657DRAFT_573167 [Parathielavia appendiculata]|uniref:Uncharacterized protein n=1 Tax=Parathielavia appendiculata TaxID=2587402 RepID=A0AAN6Z3M7_9PEZI|nr:hypothetical protein N657DRAFT_573167 [Parathielavia appendiculata]